MHLSKGTLVTIILRAELPHSGNMLLTKVLRVNVTIKVNSDKCRSKLIRYLFLSE